MGILLKFLIVISDIGDASSEHKSPGVAISSSQHLLVFTALLEWNTFVQALHFRLFFTIVRLQHPQSGITTCRDSLFLLDDFTEIVITARSIRCFISELVADILKYFQQLLTIKVGKNLPGK